MYINKLIIRIPLSSSSFLVADFLYALTGWFRNLYALTDDVGGAVRGDVRGAVGDAVFDDVSDDVGGADCVVLTVWC